MRLFYCLSIVLTSVCQAQSAEPLPNIVYIISDDQGWDDYGFMGHPHIQTPNLDQLAKQSLTFDHGYVPTSLCCPSLASLITGLYPHQHKITSNDPAAPQGMTKRQFYNSPGFRQGREVMNQHLEAVPTMPKMLAEKGYLSLQTGKWWQGNFKRGGFTHGMTTGERHGDEGLDIGRKTMQPIVKFIAEAKEKQKPFFIWYAPMLPHTPHNPPQRLLKKYQGKTKSASEARYWAMVEWFDETCGTLLNHLEEQKLADNTIVVYVCDNGWIQNPDGPLSIRSKRSPYDAGIRTPIMIRWPGHVKPQRSSDNVMSLDIMPTVLQMIGMESTAAMPGVNLLDPQARAARKTIQGATYRHDSLDLNDPAKSVRHRWIIEGDWKLIVPHVPADEDGPGTIELYNLADDPKETNNLAAQEPNRVTQLQKKLNAWWNPE